MIQCVHADSATVAIKRCTNCGEDRPFPDGFPKQGDRRHSWCRVCQKENNRRYYEKNREKIIAKEKAKYATKSEQIKSVRRARYRENPIKFRGQSNNWRMNNRQKHTAWQRKYDKNRLQNVSQRLKKNCRTRIWLALKGINKSQTSQALIGCTIEELRTHLEAQFTPEMSWENYGSFWSVDHKRACATFDLLDPEQQHACFHYTNLQPLEKIENIRKSDTPCL